MLAKSETTTSMTMTSVADQIKEALLSPYELNYATTEGKSDGLCRRLTERDVKADERSAACNCLASELEGVVGRARARRQMDREANGLLPEISRLARTKRESAALLGVMANQHSCSSSKTAPLRLQVRRLEQELDAVSSQSNYLDGELSNRNNEIASLKRNHSRRSVLCARSWTAPGWRWSAPSGTLRRRASSTTERPATSSDRRGGYATLS